MTTEPAEAALVIALIKTGALFCYVGDESNDNSTATSATARMPATSVITTMRERCAASGWL
jgi:hypothetical protein